jgi:MoxR-like ATPase
VNWELFNGSGIPHQEDPNLPAWQSLPELPSWRKRAEGEKPKFVMPDGLIDAVNAALHLRRPLLITGAAGSGKSTLVDVIAAELELGQVLKWHVTSKSVLVDALYEYDALGRLHATQAPDASAAATSVQNFVTLGPLGTALAAPQVRAVLIDEIDKSDLDLPGDLLNVMESGEFRVSPLTRARGGPFEVRGADGPGPYPVNAEGVVTLRHFPVIVFTSNGERTFSAPFLRRCIRFEMPPLDERKLTSIITEHLSSAAAAAEHGEIAAFADSLKTNPRAVNQILEFVALVTGESPPNSESRKRLHAILLRELNGP